MGTMSCTITTKKLGVSGRRSLGSTRSNCWTTTRCRRRAWRRSRRTGSSSSTRSTSTTRPRSRSPSGSTTSARKSPPRRHVSTTSRSTRPRRPPRRYLLGTFYWHIDGAQDDVPTKATMLSAHVISSKGGETEFASTYAAYDDLGDEEKEQLRGSPGPPYLRSVPAAGAPGPHARRARALAPEARQGAPARVAAPVGPALTGHRRHGGPCRRHGPRRGQGAARRPSGPCDHGPTVSTATSGRWVTWSSGTTPA